jgi:DNA modification methylase
MNPFVLHCGDALAVLKTMETESIHCCVTSPPYYGLRNYGIDGQIGLEETPAEYVAKLVEVFREVRRVLRKDGTCWLNLGDTYCSTAPGTMGDPLRQSGILAGVRTETAAARQKFRQKTPSGLKPKDLIGIPWKIAFALQADGWWLRQDIVWSKPNPMPESVKDRCTKSHEYIFLLTKSERYFFDNAAILEPLAGKPHAPGNKGKPTVDQIRGIHASKGMSGHYREPERIWGAAEGRNKRSVWTVATKPFKSAHFATMPTALVEPCILAGCPAAGKRCDCAELILTPTGSVESLDPSMSTGRAGMNRKRGSNEGTRSISRYQQRQYAAQVRASSFLGRMKEEAGPALAHYIRMDRSGARPLPPDLLDAWIARGWLQPVTTVCDCPVELGGIVIDPFAGSGTTGIVAMQHGRCFVGIELNPEYVALAQKRYDDSNAPRASLAAIFLETGS